MRKIPTVFVRDYSTNPPRLTDQVTPGCEWVLAGQGKATRKYDGTAVLVKGDASVMTRREVKPGKPEPVGFVEVEADQTTGKKVGWEPWQLSSFRKVLAEIIATVPLEPGTYELVGPKVNGNPERRDSHVLVSHQRAEQITEPSGTRTAEDIADMVKEVEARGWEGIVYHHPDGRMAKIKVRDYPKETP
jgi:hypothetical protein